MSQPHEILIGIDDDGNIHATVVGIDGPGCADASAWLDELGEVLKDENTAEYYASAQAADHLTIGNW